MPKYDYSKYEDPDWSDDWTYKAAMESEELPEWPGDDHFMDREYWGINEINGRLEIDVRRFEYACYLVDHDCFPKGLCGKGDYYIPSKVKRYDYTCNYLKDSISNLKKDWLEEYKPLFKKIFSPEDAEQSYRLGTMSMFGDSDFYDDIELGAKWAMIERMRTYNRIQAELDCVFITKVVIEIHRIILRALSMELYEKQDYTVWDLIIYCNGKGVIFYSLKNWNVYLKYNNICNFLKHNSKRSYDKLKEYNPECLVSTKDEYENGMFSVYWLNYKEVDIEKLLEDIVPFLMDFCKKVLNENPERAEWDYDEKFIEIFNELKDPNEYLGIYAACGMSPWS